MRVLAVVEGVKSGEDADGNPVFDPPEPGSLLRLPNVPPPLAAPGTEFLVVVKVRVQSVLGA